MSVVVRETTAAPTGESPISRPAWLLSIALDAALGVGAYFAAYVLRFQGDHRLGVFFHGALSTAPFVVAWQLVALGAAQAYARRPGIDWLLRVATGVVAGTIAASIFLGATMGFEGVSRSAFVADAVLLSVVAIGWRGVWVLRVRSRARADGRARADDVNDLIDRTAEMTTLTGIVGSLYGYRELLRNLVSKDLKLKYRGSVFGFLWSLLNPLLMIVVYAVAFKFILQVPGEGFVFRLMLGQLAWTFFASSAAMSTGAIIDNAGLLKSVLFPRAILPIGTVLFNLAQYLLTIAVFLPVMLLWYRVTLSGPMLLFPVFLALQVIFTTGVALLLAASTAFFRDVRHLLEVALSVLFWTTPIVYEFTRIPEQLRLLILLSPVSPFVVAYQQIFFYRQWPEPAVWLMASVHAVGAFVVGALIFLSFEDRFTEQL